MTAKAESGLGTPTKSENVVMQFFVRFRNAGVFVIFVALLVLATIISPGQNFMREANLETLLALGPEFCIIALGIGVLMIAGEFDLSIGSVLAFCALIFTVLLEQGVNPFIATVVTLIGGALIGMFNGLVTVKGQIVSFIATLGSMMFWRGMTVILAGDKMRAVTLDQYPLFTNVFIGSLGGVLPTQAIWLLFFGVILFLLLHHRRFGNWIYATGDNLMAARAMGINTGRVKIACFVIVGALCGFAAVLQMSRLAAFSSRVGTDWELRAVAAAVVGGTSLLGGRGSLVGIFLGGVIIVVIDNMVTLARLAYEWTYMVFGIVTLGAVLMDLIIEKRIQRGSAS